MRKLRSRLGIRLLQAALLLGLVGASGPARATTLQFTLAVISTAATGAGSIVFAPGTTGTVTISVDDTTPDTDPAAGSFSGVNAGTGDLDLVITFTIAAVEAGAGSWTASGTFSAAIVGGTYTLQLNGTGLTPDQPVPDFTTFSDGTLAAVGTDPGTTVDFDVLSLALVPEPAAAWLLAVGALALHRRRR